MKFLFFFSAVFFCMNSYSASIDSFWSTGCNHLNRSESLSVVVAYDKSEDLVLEIEDDKNTVEQIRAKLSGMGSIEVKQPRYIKISLPNVHSSSTLSFALDIQYSRVDEDCGINKIKISDSNWDEIEEKQQVTIPNLESHAQQKMDEIKRGIEKDGQSSKWVCEYGDTFFFSETILGSVSRGDQSELENELVNFESISRTINRMVFEIINGTSSDEESTYSFLKQIAPCAIDFISDNKQ